MNKTFFYGQETGGTVVSSCLEKALEIVEERYPVGEWNIYSAQASDGDNSYSDNMKVHQKMEELLPLLQAHYYIEIGRPSGYESPLFHTYEEISDNHNGKLYVAGGLQTTGDSLDAFKKFFPMGGSKPKPGPGPSPA
ncbi:MAG: YeaH/YhbH family protein [Alphaproteobacteria bacterium]|nr:YeaH/YhbH family protein [Alphaproteobacteria bacterium]